MSDHLEKVATANYQKVKSQCRHSLWTHIQKGMEYRFVDPSTKDMVDWVQKRWDPLNPTRKNVLVQVSRDCFKSTTITQSLPIFFLEQNPNLSILIISKVYENAVNFVRVIKKRIEDGSFKKIFGSWETRKVWSDNKLIIASRTRWRKEPSIMAAGLGTETTSLHFDVIIGDDVTTKRDMYSKADREQTHRDIGGLYDIIDKRKGLMLFIGTCWHSDDAIERIKNNNPKKKREGLLSFHIYYRPAEINIGGEWKTLWPFLTRKTLDQIRADKADIRDYSANYRLMPLPPETLIFTKFHFFDWNAETLKLDLEYAVGLLFLILSMASSLCQHVPINSIKPLRLSIMS